MAKKGFRAWLIDLGRDDMLAERDAVAVSAAAAEYAEYLKTEDAKSDPAIALQRQTDRLREAGSAFASLMARTEGRRFPASMPITWAEVMELRQKVNGLRRVLGLNEEVEELPADPPPAP
jgi:hypothetical protein